MRKIYIVLFYFTLILQSFAQSKYFTRSGHVSFHSDAALEKISADNYHVYSMLHSETGEIIIAIPIKSFLFDKALMQEHFNENYLESGKYPKANFTGYIMDMDKIDLTRDGVYKVIVEGDLTLHGITKKIKSAGKLEVQGSRLIARAVMPVLLQDYQINIPKISRDKIAETVQVKINLDYDLYKK